MQVRCPYCSTVFEATRTGVQACPNCQKQIQVPDAPAATAPIGSFPPPQPGAAGGGFGTGGGFGPGGGMPPSGGSPGPPSVRGPTPWERRRELGTIKALVDTWKDSMFGPDAFWSRVRPDGPWEDSLFYAWIVFGVGSLIQFPLRSLQAAQIRQVLDQMRDQMKGIPPEVQDFLNQYLSGRGGLIAGTISFILSIFFFPVALFLGSAILHLFCMLFGCAKNGYWATFRVSAYAISPLVFYGIPCIGFLAWIYSIVLTILGLARVQESTVGRASASALALPVLGCCCCCGGALLAAGRLAQMMQH
jgi:hypothetical protein